MSRRVPFLVATLLATAGWLACVAPPSAYARGVATPELSVSATQNRPTIPAATVATAHLFSSVPSSSPPPSGTITFGLYGPFASVPAAGSCSGTPRSVSTVPVDGFGSYSASGFIGTAGFYTWTATYSGDANHTSRGPVGCGEARATLQFLRFTASISSQATPTAGLGEPISDTATVVGWLPTGSVLFRLYGPDDPTCAGPPLFSTSFNSLVPTSTAPGIGSAQTTSSPFMPIQPGTYRWIASYLGNADNAPATTACADPGATSVVSGAAPLCTISGAGDIAGTEGDDVICGSPGPDRIAGLDGDDVIFGFGGDDRLVGGDGNDVLDGGDGNDRLDSGSGADQLYGGGGDDRLTTADHFIGDLADGGAHVLGDLCVVDVSDLVRACEPSAGSLPTAQFTGDRAN
jgi:RTX calcium-binding nonapeptide repeat (4 copies)